MEKQKLISSYDESDDIFVGKIDGVNGYVANYGISDDIFLNIDEFKRPVSVFVNNASNIFNVNKNLLFLDDIKIAIDCDELSIAFIFFIDGKKVYSNKFANNFDIRNVNYLMQGNY